MHFKIVAKIREIETIATGHGIENLNRLNKMYGKANWRKMKGVSRIELEDGAVLEAEVHWYEGQASGKRK